MWTVSIKWHLVCDRASESLTAVMLLKTRAWWENSQWLESARLCFKSPLRCLPPCSSQALDVHIILFLYHK